MHTSFSALVPILFAALASFAGSTSSSSCPDVLPFRSSHVQSSFNGTKMEGLWYEHAYIDVAQVGSRCQRLAGGLGDDGQLQISFEVLYGNKSFSIVEDYAPFPDSAVLGAYNKTVEEPFGKLLKLPTVFVNVSDDGQGGVYDFAVIYSCKLGVTELNIASRSETVDSSRVAAMIALAQHMGVPFDAKDVKYVSWTSCPQLQRGAADDV